MTETVGLGAMPSERPSTTSRLLSRLSRRSPDLKKLRGLVGIRHYELERLLETADHDVALERHARRLLAFDPSTATLEACHDHVDRLDELAPFLGDVHRVCTALERELRRSATETPIRLPDLFDGEQIEAVVGEYRNTRRLSDEQVKHARELLARLARDRNDLSRHDRVAEALKTRMVKRVFVPALLVLTAGFGAGSIVAEQGGGWWRRVLFAAAAGALGSTLSGALKLRELIEMDDVRRFSQALALQPVLGAAAGLVVFFAYVKVHGDTDPSDWLAAGLVGFAAGFSEPFFLKTVERLTGPTRPP